MDLKITRHLRRINPISSNLPLHAIGYAPNGWMVVGACTPYFTMCVNVVKASKNAWAHDMLETYTLSSVLPKRPVKNKGAGHRLLASRCFRGYANTGVWIPTPLHEPATSTTTIIPHIGQIVSLRYLTMRRSQRRISWISGHPIRLRI